MIRVEHPQAKKRHSMGKHIEGTYRDLGFGLRKFQNSIELKA